MLAVHHHGLLPFSSLCSMLVLLWFSSEIFFFHIWIAHSPRQSEDVSPNPNFQSFLSFHALSFFFLLFNYLQSTNLCQAAPLRTIYNNSQKNACIFLRAPSVTSSILLCSSCLAVRPVYHKFTKTQEEGGCISQFLHR